MYLRVMQWCYFLGYIDIALILEKLIENKTIDKILKFKSIPSTLTANNITKIMLKAP